MADILHQVRISSSPDMVYKAISTKEGLCSWWTSDVEAHPKEGSISKFGFHNRTVVFRMRIDKLVENKLATWTCLGDIDEWKDTTLHWEIENNNDGTSTLHFAHKGWKFTKGYFIDCNTTWGHLMILLKYYCEGKKVKPYFSS